MACKVEIVRHLQSISVEGETITGWLEKQSKHIKQWRERYVVIKLNTIKTYKTEEQKHVTEQIVLSGDTELNILSNNSFEIHNKRNSEHLLRFRTQNEGSMYIYIYILYTLYSMKTIYSNISWMA